MIMGEPPSFVTEGTDSDALGRPQLCAGGLLSLLRPRVAMNCRPLLPHMGREHTQWHRL